MNNQPAFHGSDLEKIEEIYHIPKEEIIPFGANVNPLGLSETVREDLAAHLDVITRYPDRTYSSLKKTIAAYTGCEKEQVIVGNGTTELISLIISLIAPKKALVLGPTYSEYERELSLAGGAITDYYLKEADDFHLDVPDFLSCLDEDTGMVILCNPNNPTSSALTREELAQIFDACRQKQIFVLVDETYAEFSPDPDMITSIPLTRTYDNVLVLRGVSKFFAAPGLRFGYGIAGSRPLLEAMERRQDPWSLNSVGAYAGEQLLKDTAYIQESRALISAERKRILKVLRDSPSYHPYPACANFVLVKIQKEGVTAADVFEKAIHEKMMIRDCSTFESLDGEFIRFCFMTPEEDDRLLNCLLTI